MAEKEYDELKLTFHHERNTKKASLFTEDIGEVEYSDKTVAVGPLYIQQQALELIGKPTKVQVTIKPIE